MVQGNISLQHFVGAEGYVLNHEVAELFGSWRIDGEAEVQTSIGKALGALTLMASIYWHVWLREIGQKGLCYLFRLLGKGMKKMPSQIDKGWLGKRWILCNLLRMVDSFYLVWLKNGGNKVMESLKILGDFCIMVAVSCHQHSRFCLEPVTWQARNERNTSCWRQMTSQPRIFWTWSNRKKDIYDGKKTHNSIRNWRWT